MNRCVTAHSCTTLSLDVAVSLSVCVRMIEKRVFSATISSFSTCRIKRRNQMTMDNMQRD